MNQTISLIQRVQIASPCTASWDEMIGDDTSRFCSHCKLNVYNLSAMTAEEGEKLIIANEGKLCTRIYRRNDGTVLTKDCPVGLKALRRRLVWATMRTAAALVFVAAATVSVIAGSKSRDRGFMYDGTNWVKAPGDSSGPTAYQQTVASVKKWLAAAPPPAQTGFFMGDVGMPTTPANPPSTAR